MKSDDGALTDAKDAEKGNKEGCGTTESHDAEEKVKSDDGALTDAKDAEKENKEDTTETKIAKQEVKDDKVALTKLYRRQRK